MLIKGTGTIEKFEIMGNHVHDVVMDSGKDLADMLATYEGERVRVFIFDAGESEDLINYAQEQSEKAKKLATEIQDLEIKIKKLTDKDPKGNALVIMSKAVEMMVKGFQLNTVFEELKRITESEL
ncbi:MAG: hypothetical protein JSU04_00140 [Bdellovibrionales bacterium]|nr:hypothetical protein [Bdellovibrionales bacterium]